MSTVCYGSRNSLIPDRDISGIPLEADLEVVVAKVDTSQHLLLARQSRDSHVLGDHIINVVPYDLRLLRRATLNHTWASANDVYASPSSDRIRPDDGVPRLEVLTYILGGAPRLHDRIALRLCLSRNLRLRMDRGERAEVFPQTGGDAVVNLA